MGPANYWGFKQLRYRELEEVVGASQGVLFLGGHPTRFMAYAVEELLTWYPFVPLEKTMQVGRTPWVPAFQLRRDACLHEECSLPPL